MYKRGQLTLLIILGLLVVGSAALVYVYKDEIFLSQWERERSESLSVPGEAEELHQEISVCVEDIAADAVSLLGQQGGYIVLPEDALGEGAYNPFSNSLEIFPASDFQTAYWFYEAANGVEHSQVPSIEQMEQELGIYMNTHLTSCANDFELFSSYNATAGLVSTDVEILEDEVLFTVHYPVHIALDDFSFAFEAFYVSQDIPLGQMYKAAAEIMETENEDFVLEELSYDALVLYDEEVPLSWTGFDCEQETWDVDEVEENLKNILAENILAVKVRGTEYEVHTESDRDYFEFDMLEAAPEAMSVNMLYSPDWPFSMQVYPSEGSSMVEDTLTGSPVSSYLSGLFCLNNYNFIYDIKYPVLISLYDADSDYRFQFASMVVLDNNQPRENTEGLLDLRAVEDTICEDVQTELRVDVVEVEEDGSLQSIEDATVRFQCITSLCALGSTGREDSFLVPACVNAVVSAEKEGYQKGSEIVSTVEDSSVTVVLEKYYNLTYDIAVVDAEGNVRNPASDEVLFVTLTDKDTGYSTTVSYPYTSDSLLLIPGEYSVQGNLVSEVPFDISIDSSEYTTCTSVPHISLSGLFGFENDADCTDVEISEVELQTALAGGVDRSWQLDRYDVQDASHVTLYVTSPGLPEDVDELEEVYAYVDSGLGYKEPELS